MSFPGQNQTIFPSGPAPQFLKTENAANLESEEEKKRMQQIAYKKLLDQQMEEKRLLELQKKEAKIKEDLLYEEKVKKQIEQEKERIKKEEEEKERKMENLRKENEEGLARKRAMEAEEEVIGVRTGQRARSKGPQGRNQTHEANPAGDEYYNWQKGPEAAPPREKEKPLPGYSGGGNYPIDQLESPFPNIKPLSGFDDQDLDSPDGEVPVEEMMRTNQDWINTAPSKEYVLYKRREEGGTLDSPMRQDEAPKRADSRDGPREQHFPVKKSISSDSQGQNQNHIHARTANPNVDKFESSLLKQLEEVKREALEAVEKRDKAGRRLEELREIYRDKLEAETEYKKDLEAAFEKTNPNHQPQVKRESDSRQSKQSRQSRNSNSRQPSGKSSASGQVPPSEPKSKLPLYSRQGLVPDEAVQSIALDCVTNFVPVEYLNRLDTSALSLRKIALESYSKVMSQMQSDLHQPPAGHTQSSSRNLTSPTTTTDPKPPTHPSNLLQHSRKMRRSSAKRQDQRQDPRQDPRLDTRTPPTNFDNPNPTENSQSQRRLKSAASGVSSGTSEGRVSQSIDSRLIDDIDRIMRDYERKRGGK